VAADALLGLSLVIAYTIRFHSGLIPLRRHSAAAASQLLPFIVVPSVGFHLQACIAFTPRPLRVDDFFAVFVGSIRG
jgi:hypothetical protein